VDFQLVPPHVHHRNATDHAIQMFKNHFIASLCSTNKNFPLHLWDHLLPQAELTLNLLCSSHLNPHLSAWAQLHGPFDFNHTPIAPPGTRIIIHEKPSICNSWALHGINGWYLGPAMDSYQCYMVWANETQSQCITDTVAWFPSKIPMPATSSINYIKAGIANIIHALQFSSPNLPLAPLSDSHSRALQQLMLILHGTTNPNQPTPAPATSLRVDAPALLTTGSPIVAPTIPLTPAPSISPRQLIALLSCLPPILESTTPNAPSLRVALPSPHPNDDTIPMDNCTNK